MTDKKDTSRDNLQYEKVVLEKIEPHVEFYGPYTKRELRRLLLSLISLHPRADTEDDLSTGVMKKGEEKNKIYLSNEETLKFLDLSEEELKKIKDGQQLNEKTEKMLQALGITKDVIMNAKKGIEKRSGSSKSSRSFFKKAEKSKFADSKITKSMEDARNDFIELLKQKQISEDFITQLLKNGLTEETIRFLKSLEFSIDDIENLQKLWQSGIQEYESYQSDASEPSSSDEYMSLDSLYLKSNISVPIKKALREITLRKPKDPVEFLGQWLLHFKVCEEREKKRKESEIELMVEREKFKLKKSEIEDSFLNQDDKEGGEECEEFFNFLEDNEIY